MIDWLSLTFKYNRAVHIRGGLITEYGENGEIKWSIAKYKEVAGSYSTRVCVRSLDVDKREKTSLVEISGNPSKFFQGHNLFGTDNMQLLAPVFIVDVMRRLGYDMTDENKQQLYTSVEIKRVDNTRMYQLPSRQDVREWIRCACVVMSSSQQKIDRGQTLYVGKHSRRITTKIYGKGDEFDRLIMSKDSGRLDKRAGRSKDYHIGNITTESRLMLLEYADKALRVEICIRSMELKKRRLNNLSAWFYESPCNNMVQRLIDERIKVMKLPEQYEVKEDILVILPRTLKATYLMWRSGHDLRSWQSKNTYYRHRRELLPFGVDISVPVPPPTFRIVPLMRTLEAVPDVNIPEWAHDRGLFFNPALLRVAA